MPEWIGGITAQKLAKFFEVLSENDEPLGNLQQAQDVAFRNKYT